MTKAFVFGKFMPFHKGHEAMIHFALSHCDFLTVLICCSTQERLSADLRKSWLENTFQDISRISIRTYLYDETLLPNTSETSAAVSEVWAAAFKELVPDHQLVITSEPYGDLVAGFMDIQHLPFNPERNLYPVSASSVRKDLPGAWAFLPDAVKSSLVTKVVLLGTESTGKTTLTEKLAHHFNASAVMEAGRDIVADSNDFGIADLYLIADTHAARIRQMETGNSPLVIIDTDIHITLSYGVYAFGEMPDISADIYQTNQADLYLYLNNDVPYFQDGTRLSEAERNLLDLSHRKVLADRHIPYEEITGNWEERFDKSEHLIEALLQRKMASLW